MKNAVEGLNQTAADLVKFGNDLAKQVRDQLEPAFKEYAKKDKQVQDAFNEMAKDVLTEDLGCELNCVDRCTQRNDFFAFSECVSGCCAAYEQIVEVEEIPAAQVLANKFRAETFARKYARLHQ